MRPVRATSPRLRLFAQRVRDYSLVCRVSDVGVVLFAALLVSLTTPGYLLTYHLLPPRIPFDFQRTQKV